MPRIKGLIFDLDNTLFRCGRRYRDFYNVTAAMAASRLGLQGSLAGIVETLDSMEIRGNEDVARFAAAHGLQEKALVHAFNSVAGEMFPALSADPNYAELLPELPGLMATVHLPMAVVTRGPRSWAEPVIRHLGLGSAIPPAFIFPVEDPELDDPRTPAGFRTIAGKLRADPKELAMVDDTADNFLLSQPLGFHSILVHWGQALEPQPPHVCEQVRDVRVLLRRLAGPTP